MVDVPRAALEVYEVGTVHADPVPKVHDLALTAGASASHATLQQAHEEVAVVRVAVHAQSSACAKTARSSSSTLRTKPPDASASACERKDRSNQYTICAVHFFSHMRASGTLRSRAMRGGRAVACCMCARTSITPRRKRPAAIDEAEREVEVRSQPMRMRPTSAPSAWSLFSDRDEGVGYECP